MIIQGAEFGSNTDAEFDICVIGGGVAGITLALELGRQGIRTVLLEAGGLSFDDHGQNLYDGEISGQAAPPLKHSRARVFGGTNTMWAGYIRSLSPADFEKRQWVTDSGWPIEYGDLEPYHRRAGELLGIEDIDFDAQQWSKKIQIPTMPHANGSIIDGVTLIKKASFVERHWVELSRSRSAFVVLNTTIKNLVVDQISDTVSSAICVAPDGQEHGVCARIFVLAGGGLENARILLLSNDVRTAGIGNQHDLVGRYFMDHKVSVPGYVALNRPFLNLQFYRKNTIDDDTVLEGSLRLSELAQRHHGLTNVHFSLISFSENFMTAGVQTLRGLRRRYRQWFDRRPVPLVQEQNYGALFREFGTVSAYAMKRLTGLSVPRGGTWLLKAEVEQIPNRESRLTLSQERDRLGLPKAKLNWQSGPGDWASVRSAINLLDHDLRVQGSGSAICLFDAGAERPRLDYMTGNHHSGTTRMAASPNNGVTDGNCRVFGTNNLYVSGSSLFPTIGTAPPTFTIICLTLRLAASLARQLDQKQRNA